MLADAADNELMLIKRLARDRGDEERAAVLDNGVRIMVPPHIESGTRIVVDVYEQTYVGKAS